MYSCHQRLMNYKKQVNKLHNVLSHKAERLEIGLFCLYAKLG